MKKTSGRQEGAVRRANDTGPYAKAFLTKFPPVGQ